MRLDTSGRALLARPHSPRAVWRQVRQLKPFQKGFEVLKSRGTEETFAHANVHVVTPASCRQDAGATKCGAAAVAFQLFYFALHDFCLLALLVKRRWSLLVRLHLARMNWFLLLLGGRVFARDAASGDHSKKSCRPLWSWQRVDATGAVMGIRRNRKNFSAPRSGSDSRCR